MANISGRFEKSFIVLGVITVLSGIFLIFEENYVVGVSGSIVGLGLVFQNIKQLREKKDE